MAHALRTHTLSKTRGFMKALVERGGGRTPGFTPFGPEAGEVMAAVQVTTAGQLPFTIRRDAVRARPSMAEGLGGLFAGVPTGLRSHRTKRAGEGRK